MGKAKTTRNKSNINKFTFNKPFIWLKNSRCGLMQAFGKLFDKCMHYLVNFIEKLFKMSLQPTQSRWGFTAILLAICFFCLSFSSSSYAIYLSFIGGAIVVDIPPMIPFVMFLVFGVIGIIAFVVFICFITYFLRHQNTTNELATISQLQVDTIKAINTLPIEIGTVLITSMENRNATATKEKTSSKTEKTTKSRKAASDKKTDRRTA